MRYSVEGVCEKFKSGEKLEFLFFWGHTKNKNGKITKACFSQWYLSDFTVNGVLYNCAEKYMMAEKARLFKDYETLEEILSAENQKEIKDLGRKIKNFNEELWNREKYEIVKRGNLAKFSQNENLKEFLLNTGDKIIVEASPYDSIWGIGMGAKDENIEYPTAWKGENLLGFAIMEVRDLLNKRSTFINCRKFFNNFI
ncbi:NADAR family protein [Clostridium perfringens]|uniref:NADAR family protein n=1 Tax=Clostridium perfringens TaxID=1502 RepID=UPI003747F5B2